MSSSVEREGLEEYAHMTNHVTNIIYQSERNTFGDCELIMRQVIRYLYKEGVLNLDRFNIIKTKEGKV